MCVTSVPQYHNLVEDYFISFSRSFRFVDRDGDGYISADDIFAVQALLMQRSEVFLRVGMPMYSHVLGYILMCLLCFIVVSTILVCVLFDFIVL